jgi:type III secretory pathway component EscT
LETVPSLLSSVASALTRADLDLEAVGLAWARALPAVAIVPAFGLRALPPAARAVFALALAAVVFPALSWMHPPGPGSHSPTLAPWPLAAVGEMLLGLPVAIAAAVPLWAATMAGGCLDALRGGTAQGAPSAPTVEAGATPLGVVFSILASAIFLGSGGPARVALALVAAPTPEGHPVLSVVRDLTEGIALAVAIGGPLLAASVVIEVAGALLARAAAPAQLHLLLAPLRALALLVLLGISLERMAMALASAIELSPAHP